MAIRTQDSKVVVPPTNPAAPRAETQESTAANAATNEQPAESAQPESSAQTETTEQSADQKTTALPTAAKTTAAAPAVFTGAAPSFMQLKNALPAESVGNTFPRLVPGAGMIRTDSKIQLGRHLDLQVISISDRYMWAPVADMNKDQEAKKYCRASYDGEHIIDNETGDLITLEEWQEQAAQIRKASNKPVYEEWKKAKYMDVYAIIFGAEQSYLETAKALGLVQVSISPTAIKPFNAFFMQAKINVIRGLLPACKQNCMRLVTMAGSNSRGDDYSYFSPTLVPLADIEVYTPVNLEF